MTTKTLRLRDWWLGLAVLCLLGLPSCRPRPAVPDKSAPTSLDATRTAAGADMAGTQGANQKSPAAAEAPTSVVSPVDAWQPIAQQTQGTQHDGSDAGTLPSEGESPTWKPQGAWTTQRLIVLAETGPCLIDLLVSVGGESLDQASQKQLKVVADELLTQLQQPAKWEELLELPLVRSGWLGNLIPAEGQREQVLSLYDTQRDGIVVADELPAFLSRGLARLEPLQVSDVGYASDFDPSQSPWGKADRNQDFSLDPAEREAFRLAVQQQDLNGDGVLSRRELTGSVGMQPTNMSASGRTSMLRSTTLLLGEPSVTTSNPQPVESHDSPPIQPPELETSKAARKLAGDVLRHYTFLSELSREQWPDWSDQQWALFDADENQKLDQIELRQLVACPPQAQLYVSLPHSNQASNEPSREPQRIHAQLTQPTATWHDSETGGQLVCGGCCVRLELTDVFSDLGSMQLRQQLVQALKNPQLQAFFTRRLELSANAFELLDEDQDAALSDAEFVRVWRWLASRQSARLLGRWMLTTGPWFQLADGNADGRLSELEVQVLSQRLAKLDRNGDGLVTPNELPVVATLALSRTDSRLDALPPGAGAMATPAIDSDWFGAMDTNRDGSLSSAEFLGEVDTFSRMDANQDGFLSRGEVYFPKASN